MKVLIGFIIGFMFVCSAQSGHEYLATTFLSVPLLSYFMEVIKDIKRDVSDV